MAHPGLEMAAEVILDRRHDWCITNESTTHGHLVFVWTLPRGRQARAVESTPNC